MPVYKIEKEMPHSEFCEWMEFLKMRPIGWREDMRTAMIMRSFGAKERPEQIFESLRLMKESNRPKAAAGIVNSPIFSHMMKAVGGDSLEEILGESKIKNDG